jgi:hypothetical protein
MLLLCCSAMQTEDATLQEYVGNLLAANDPASEWLACCSHQHNLLQQLESPSSSSMLCK